jgi:hypothetical protein
VLKGAKDLRKSWLGRLKKPIPPRRLLWAAALLNGLIAAVTFHVGKGEAA